MRGHTWSGVTGSFSIGICVVEGIVYDYDLNVLPIPAEMAQESFELTIDFVSSGYYDPGCTSGPADNWYPPEGDDDRELDGCWLDGVDDDNKIYLLDKTIMCELWNIYQDEIYKVELEEQY